MKSPKRRVAQTGSSVKGIDGSSDRGWAICRRVLISLAALLCTCAVSYGSSGIGTNFSFTGAFTRDDQSEIIIFTAASSSVTIRTFGYAGGINAAGSVIPAGGFDPVISLFDATGTLGPSSLLLGANNDGDSLPKDPATGNAFDSLLVLNSLTPGGRYALVLTQADNSATGPDFGSGFHQDLGGAAFTSQLFGCAGPSFCDDSPAQRSGRWAIDVLGAATAIDSITNVSSQVSVTQTGFGRNRATGNWVASLTITNTGGRQLNAPIQVVFTNLTPGVTMVNNTGVQDGSPYLTVLRTGTLAASASVVVTIEFQNPSSGFINFTPITESVQF